MLECRLVKESFSLKHVYLNDLIADASVGFVHSFSTSIQNYQISILNDGLFEFSNVEHYQDNVFIVDIRCPNIQRIINQVKEAIEKKYSLNLKKNIHQF